MRNNECDKFTRNQKRLMALEIISKEFEDGKSNIYKAAFQEDFDPDIFLDSAAMAIAGDLIHLAISESCKKIGREPNARDLSEFIQMIFEVDSCRYVKGAEE